MRISSAPPASAAWTASGGGATSPAGSRCGARTSERIMAGRPTKYTPERVQRIETALAAGATYRLACGYAGISEATFTRWRERYADFAELLARVEASAALR